MKTITSQFAGLPFRWRSMPTGDRRVISFSTMSNSINFHDGSSIKWVDRETLPYSEGAYTTLIWVDFEPGLFSRGRIIKASSIVEWETTPDNFGKVISDSKRAEIIKKVSEYYDKNKKKYRIEEQSG